MAKMIELCKVYSFTTSSILCQRTTVWNTDAPNCYITRWLFGLLTFASSIQRRALWGLIILWY